MLPTEIRANLEEIGCSQHCLAYRGAYIAGAAFKIPHYKCPGLLKSVKTKFIFAKRQFSLIDSYC